MSKNREFGYRTIIIMLTVILVMTLVQSPRTTQAAPQASGAPMVGVTVFNVSCNSRPLVWTTYSIISNLGIFTVNSAESLMELTYNGRISVNGFTDSTGAIFELRVDDVTSTVGRARAKVLDVEAGSGGVQVSITGMFKGLTAGNHTASMWVGTTYGTASTAMVNPDCWSTDVLIVKEHLPFGFSYLPMITK